MSYKKCGAQRCAMFEIADTEGADRTRKKPIRAGVAARQITQPSESPWEDHETREGVYGLQASSSDASRPP